MAGLKTKTYIILSTIAYDGTYVLYAAFFVIFIQSNQFSDDMSVAAYAVCGYVLANLLLHIYLLKKQLKRNTKTTLADYLSPDYLFQVSAGWKSGKTVFRPLMLSVQLCLALALSIHMGLIIDHPLIRWAIMIIGIINACAFFTFLTNMKQLIGCTNTRIYHAARNLTPA